MNQIQFSRPKKTVTVIPPAIPVLEAIQIGEAFLPNLGSLFRETLREVQCCLLQVDANRKIAVHPLIQATLPSESLIELSLELAQTYQSLLSQGQSLIFRQTDPWLSIIVKKSFKLAEVNSLMIVPLHYQQCYLGSLCLYQSGPSQSWTEEQLNVIQALGVQCTLILTHTQIQEQLKHQQWQQDLLKQINQTLNSPLAPEQVIAEILRIVGEGFAVERALILQGKPNQSQIYQAWHRNEPIASELAPHFSLEESSSVLPVSIQCQPQAPAFHFCTYSPTNCQSQRIESSPFDSCLSVPLFLRQEFFGTVTLVSLIPSRTFSLAESQTLEVIAQQIAIAVQNAQTQQRLQKLQQCTQELAEEKQRSEAVNQAKTEFLSHIHHELRTPLTGILGFSRLLKDELYGSLNPKQKQYVSAIATSGEHLLALVNDFLDMSKIEANREELYWETIPAEEVCLGAITMLQSRAAQQGLELRLEVAQNVDFCRGDQRRLKQILVNLLSNALKFTEAGSVTLQVKRQENMLEFSVIDTGIGIKKEDYQKLFQPFQQIQNHLSRKHKGTGLGLTLSRKLAQLHGGDITFASEEGKGSCFTLHLPV